MLRLAFVAAKRAFVVVLNNNSSSKQWLDHRGWLSNNGHSGRMAFNLWVTFYYYHLNVFATLTTAFAAEDDRIKSVIDTTQG